MIFGMGLTSSSKDANVDQWLELVKLVGDGTCLRRAAFDMKLYGHCYLNVIWSNDRSRPAELHHIDAASVRAGIAEDEDEPSIYYIHDNWTEVNKKPPRAIPAFNTQDREAASQILHIRTYSPMNYYYAVPDYIGSTNYIELDRDISEFHLNNIKNGLFPSMMLTFNNGVPTEDERDEMERAIYDKFSGANNAGKILINWNDNKDDAPSVEPFNLNDPHKMYDYLSEQVNQRILSGHRVTSPLLFGIRSEGGGFGSNADEMRDAYDLYMNVVIKPYQDELIKGLSPVFSASNIILGLSFKPLQPATFLKVDNLFGETEGVATNDKDASYNGAQIASAVEVLVKVQEGIITEEQAKVFLVQMLQFTTDVADALFVEGIDAIAEVEKQEVVTESNKVEQFKKKKLTAARITEDQGRAWLSHLEDKNEQPPWGYQLWKKEQVISTDYDHRIHNRMNFGLEEYDNHELYSEWGDVVSPKGYHFALRYQYSQNDSTTESKTGKSRDFCQEMVELSKDGVMYRYEDISDMSNDGINGQFAAEGENTYDLFEHKGGVNCYHSWLRLIYVYAPDGEVSEEGLEEIIPDEWDATMRQVGNNPYVPQKGNEAYRPIDGKENK